MKHNFYDFGLMVKAQKVTVGLSVCHGFKSRIKVGGFGLVVRMHMWVLMCRLDACECACGGLISIYFRVPWDFSVIKRRGWLYIIVGSTCKIMIWIPLRDCYVLPECSKFRTHYTFFFFFLLCVIKGTGINLRIRTEPCYLQVVTIVGTDQIEV